MAEKKEKQYVSDNAQLMSEWNLGKNTDVDPVQLTLVQFAIPKGKLLFLNMLLSIISQNKD